MIARGNAATPARGVLVVIVRDPVAERPVWSPGRPRGGWTPSAAFDAASAYALDAADHEGDIRRLTSVAYRALMNALPREVKRAELVERINGIDRLRPDTNAKPERDDAPF